VEDLGTPVLTLEHADGTAAVLREEDGSLWLTGYLEGGGGTMLDGYHGSIEGLGDDRLVQAGLLPRGAVSVALLDRAGQRLEAAVGDEAWLAIVEHHDDGPVPVLFRDAGGEIVRPPLPADWPREPVNDARRECGVCGAFDWDEVTPLDESRGMHGRAGGPMQPVKFVCCRVCGHEIRSGGWVTVSHDDVERDEFLAQQHRKHREVLERATIPVFVLDGWDDSRDIAGWGGRDGQITSLTVAHGDESGPRWARVQIDTDGPWEGLEVAARSALSRLIQNNSEWDPHVSLAAMSIALDSHEREAAVAAHGSPLQQRDIDIDGRPHAAVLAAAGNTAVCVLDTDDGRIMISARNVGPDELALNRLSNPLDEL
jgi:hypothetical protein